MKVLQAAAREIREHGPDRISVASVMGGAGLTHGAFYAHFPSKSALVAESIDFMFDETSARLEKLMQGKAPGAALAAYIDGYLSEIHCNTRNASCPLAALNSDAPRLDAESKMAFERGIAQRQSRVADLIRQLGSDNPEMEARSIQSELIGALVSARLVESPERESILSASRQMLKQRYGLDVNP